MTLKRHKEKRRGKTQGIDIMRKNGRCFAKTQRFPHHFSIADPSLLHRNDGLSMDYRWIIDGQSYESLTSSKRFFRHEITMKSKGNRDK